MLLEAAAFAAASAGAQYPLEDVLDAAQEACATVLGSEDAAGELGKAGWRPVAAGSSDWVDEGLDVERDLYGPGLSQSKVYTKRVSGRDLFLFANLLTMADKGAILRVCALQDPKADIESAPDRIAAWAGRPWTSGKILQPDVDRIFDTIVYSKNWKPGFRDGSDDATIRYVPLEWGVLSANQNAGLTYSSERIFGMEAE